MTDDEDKAGTPLNCWEYMSCGREPGGGNAERLGVCPAATNKRLDLVHGGKNGGRACWTVAGSFSRRKKEGIFCKEIRDCKECDFYHVVKSEEGRYFWPEGLLRKLLHR